MPRRRKRKKQGASALSTPALVPVPVPAPSSVAATAAPDTAPAACEPALTDSNEAKRRPRSRRVRARLRLHQQQQETKEQEVADSADDDVDSCSADEPFDSETNNGTFDSGETEEEGDRYEQGDYDGLEDESSLGYFDPREIQEECDRSRDGDGAYSPGSSSSGSLDDVCSGSSWSDTETGTFFTPQCKSDRLVSKFVIDKRIEKGGFASVFRVTQCRGRGAPRQLAMKVYSTNTETNAARELEIVRAVTHPNIMQLTHAGTFEASNGIQYDYVTMRLFPQDLASVIYDLDASGHVSQQAAGRPLEPMHYRQILGQVLNALQALHDKGFVHADLKPENLLVDMTDWDNVVVQLCDFGSAYDMDDEEHDPYGHTLILSAPEVITNTASLLGPPVDVFAFGCLFVELVCEQSLFFSSEPVMHLAHVQQVNGGAPFPAALKTNRRYFTRSGFLTDNAQRRVAHCQPWHHFMGLDQPGIDFVEGCCRMEPSERLRIGELRERIDALFPSVPADGQVPVPTVAK
jgi:serine/threonine protein kinase